VLGLLAYQLHSYGPTLGDPDPDGYISYANGLKETLSIQPHRRLPGYPLIVAVVDSLGSGGIAVKMFWFHLILTIAFVAVTAGFVWHFFGYSVAAVYSALMAYNSYFARDAIVMIADLPLVVVFYTACAVGLAFLVPNNKPKPLFFGALFFVACAISVAIHPSAHMLVQILIFCAGVVFSVMQIKAASPLKRFEKVKRIVTPLLFLAILAFTGKELVMNTLQFDTKQDYLHLPDVSASSRNFLESWIGFRMLLCLPPGQQNDAVDVEIETLKSKVGLRTGYPVEAVVPPGYYVEFLPLLDGKTVESRRWKDRGMQHPLKILRCAASEFRAKYNTLIKNLTPFTDFNHDKSWVTVSYPANTGSPRDELFWTTGINLINVLPADASSISVTRNAKLEATRIVLVIVLTVGGLIMIGHTFPGVGAVFLGTLLIWVGALPVALPLETRYLMTFFPIIYTGQAIFIVYIVALIWKSSGKFAGATFSWFKKDKNDHSS
jgi:hypothetical protein